MAVAAQSAQPRPRHRAATILLVIVAVIIAIAIVVRLLLDPIATRETRKALNNMQGIHGDFARVHVTVLPPSYQITNLKIFQDDGPGTSTQPLFFVKEARLSVAWRQLLHGRLVAAGALHEPKIVYVQPKKPPQQPPPHAPSFAGQLRRAPSLRLDRLEVFSGQVLLFLREGDEQPRLWIHDLAVTAQNLATRHAQAHGRAASVTARGEVGRSGELRLFVSADPFASPLAFAGEASLEGLRANELYAFISAKSDLEADQGTIDLFATFSSKNGMITGGVKPVLKNIHLQSTDEGLWAEAKTWLLDKAVSIASDRVPERNAVATTIPIKGRLVDPDVQLWPAVLGVVRNAFVTGLSSGFANVPPKTAPEKQGILEQAKEALKKKSGPPRAQPHQR